MRGNIYLAVAAVAFAFLLQPARAQDDEEWTVSQCVDAVAANSDDPAALTRIGIRRGEANLVAEMHNSIELDFANLVLMKQYLDNLELLKPVLVGKKNAYALDILNKTSASLRGQMDQLRKRLNEESTRVLAWASIKCERMESTGHFEEPENRPPVSIGIGVGGGYDHEGDHRGSHRHHNRHNGRGSENPNSDQQDDNQQPGEPCIKAAPH